MLKKIDEIKNLIDKTFPVIEPDYNFKHLTKHYDVKFKTYNGYYYTITIVKDSTWVEIKKNIERIIKTPKLDVTTKCLICYDNKFSELIFCENCLFIECEKCMNEIVSQNCGKHICPQCRNILTFF